MKDKKPTQSKANPSQKQHEQMSTSSKSGQRQEERHAGSAPAKGGNSISFEKCDYDTKQHLLRAQFKQGGNSITCCINQDVFTELYHCKPSESELKSSFNQHQSEISRALLAKIANKQWKVPNKEIQLNAQDLRK
jgi:hypothetical protein